MTTLATPRLPPLCNPRARKPVSDADERPLLQDPHYALLNLLYAALMQGASSTARWITDSSHAPYAIPHSKIKDQKSHINITPEVHHGSQ